MNAILPLLICCMSAWGIGSPSALNRACREDVIRIAGADDNKVELNTATLEEIEQLPGMDEDGAKSIIAHRPYKMLSDLKKADLSAREILLITPLVSVKEPVKKAANQPSISNP